MALQSVTTFCRARRVKIHERVVSCNVYCAYEHVGNEIPAEIFGCRFSPIRTDTERSRRWHNSPSLLLPDCVDQPSQRRDVEELIKPAGDRKRQTTWATFLKAHWDVLAAIDFTTVEVWSTRGLITFYLLLVMDLKSRRAEFVNSWRIITGSEIIRARVTRSSSRVTKLAGLMAKWNAVSGLVVCCGTTIATLHNTT